MNARNKRNLNPHKLAVLARYIFHHRYMEQLGGQMDFWDGLTDGEKQVCRDCLSEVTAAKDEK